MTATGRGPWKRELGLYSQLAQGHSQIPRRSCSSCMLFVYKKLVNKQSPRIHHSENGMDLILLMFNLF